MIEYPKLDLPGAGLPWLESLFLRYVYYPSRLHKTSWQQNLERLRTETQKISKICDSIDEQQFQTRILIPRLRGMEDSSRFWSVGLAIQHLLITIEGMSHIAEELAKSHTISIEVDIAKVKPRQEDVTNKNDMLKKLQLATETTVQKLLPYHETPSRNYKQYHPWFGRITAEGWVWVLGQHQSLHRKQMQMIVKQL